MGPRVVEPTVRPAGDEVHAGRLPLGNFSRAGGGAGRTAEGSMWGAWQEGEECGSPHTAAFGQALSPGKVSLKGPGLQPIGEGLRPGQGPEAGAQALPRGVAPPPCFSPGGTVRSSGRACPQGPALCAS